MNTTATSQWPARSLTLDRGEEQPPLAGLPFAASPLLRTHCADQAQAYLNQQIEERRIHLKDQAPLEINFTLQALSQLKLFGASWGREVRVSSSPLHSWHAILPLQGAISSPGQGLQAVPGQLLVFTPGHEVDVVWHESTQAVVVALDTALLRQHLERHHQNQVPRLPPQALLIEQCHPALLTLGNLLRLVDMEGSNPSGLLASPIGQAHIQHLFCENLLSLVPTLDRLPQRCLLPGTVKRVVDYIQAHLHTPLLITELVNVSGASRRSLEQAFRKNMGTSLQRYIQGCRLQAIREILQLHQPAELQISELALQWGFAQPSHFTSAYKQAFDELPSQTLARPR